MLASGLLVSLLAFAGDASSACRPPRLASYPICSHCVPYEDVFAPGIGFDLTLSYATAAIRYHNGSLINLGRVDGSDEYKALMIRLSDPASRPACDRDFQNFWEKVRCAPKHASRRINKLRGLPATPEVGIIAQLLDQLRLLVDSQLGQGTTKKVLPVIPELPGLWRTSEHDLTDVLEYAGLHRLSTHKDIPEDVSEISATLAGMDYGLCKDYNDAEKCENEEGNWQTSHILALSLSQMAFSATYSVMRGAYIGFALLNNSITSFHLGLNNVPEDEFGKGRYWKDIHNTIVEVGRKRVAPLTHVLVIGEDADNSTFILVVKDALRSLLLAFEMEALEIGLPGQNGHYSPFYAPLYVASRGAAEFAKRAQEAPVRCKEPARCAGNRAPPKDSANTQILFDWEL